MLFAEVKCGQSSVNEDGSHKRRENIVQAVIISRCGDRGAALKLKRRLVVGDLCGISLQLHCYISQTAACLPNGKRAHRINENS